MKKINMFSLALVVLLSFLFSTACQEESSIVAPGKTSVSSEEPNWVGLPVPNDTRLQKTFTVSELITKQSGGVLSLRESYVGGPHGEVEVFATIKFAPNALSEDTQVTMSLDDETGVLSFTPSMSFNRDAALTFSLGGMDLTGLSEDDVDFKYYDANGQYVSVDYNKLSVDINHGGLGVLKVDIPHFSRYGFTK